MSVTKLNSSNFEQEVMNQDKPVLIDFFATWCGPCMMMAPIIDGLADEIPDAKICNVDVTDQPELAERFGVMNIPTLLIIKNGEEANRSVGAISKEAVIRLIRS